jgi:heme-degrading monooxygenase HmoA
MQGKYAVIFASTKFNPNEEYQSLDAQLMDLAQVQEGFLGYESVANDNRSIFISYWETKEAIDQWRDHARHLYAKTRVGAWYERYLSQICFVESSHEWVKPI